MLKKTNLQGYLDNRKKEIISELKDFHNRAKGRSSKIEQRLENQINFIESNPFTSELNKKIIDAVLETGLNLSKSLAHIGIE